MKGSVSECIQTESIPQNGVSWKHVWIVECSWPETNSWKGAAWEPVWMQAPTFTDWTSKGRVFQFHKSRVNCQPLKNAMEQIKKRLHRTPNSHATSSVAFRLTMVPSPSTVARHWYSPLSESPPFSWTTLSKAREPFSSMYLEWPNKQHKEKCVKTINKQSNNRFHNNKKKWIHKCELQ